jgi:D-alanyl-D-alanine carboxypeptidase/D-alanyl-D-alanine-endopeptidase (penicillin-binding protein 4)
VRQIPVQRKNKIDMQKNILFTLLFLFAGLVRSQTPLQRLVSHPALKHASVGVSVVELGSKRSIVSHDAEKSLAPASTAKLITTATALETLGENYRYRTDVALDADNPSRILVLGSGDPTLGSEAFGDSPDAFFISSVEALKKNLDANRVYSIYVVDNLFGYDGVSPEWTWIDIGNYYAAGAYGVSIFDNSYRLFLNTSGKGSCPRILRVEPEIKGLTFQNSLSSNTSGQDNGYIYGAPFSYDREVRGNIPAGKAEFSIKGDIPDPGALLGETLAAFLARAGFRTGKVETARADYLSAVCPAADRTRQPFRTGRVIFTQTSRPLKEIIREVNVKSNNHYAEHLIRTVGRSSRKDIYADALQAGIEYTRKFWEKNGIAVTSLQMYDGSGLALRNGVSAQFLTDLLVYMYGRNGHSGAFVGSLPKAGREGTLQYFLRDTVLGGKVVAKSGSIAGVQCFSGYLIDGNKKYAFTVMVNRFNGSRSEVRKAIEQFLTAL